MNELTTVAAAFTCAQFFKGLQLSGNLKGIRIAAKNTPNLVNPVTGSWGEVLTDPFNITQNETLARLNTLGALITAYGTIAHATRAIAERQAKQRITLREHLDEEQPSRLTSVAHESLQRSALRPVAKPQQQGARDRLRRLGIGAEQLSWGEQA